MKVAWAVACLLVTMAAAHWMMYSASPLLPGSGVSLGLLLTVNWGPALAILSISFLAARAVGRPENGASAAVILAVLSLLLAISRAFWHVAAPMPHEFTSSPIAESFLAPMWGVACGGLFLESLRRRVSRRAGGLAEPVIGDAWLILCVPLAGLLILLTVVRVD